MAENGYHHLGIKNIRMRKFFV